MLEVIERVSHFVPDKEIPEEHVDLNSLLCGLMGLIHVYNWDSSRKYVFVAWLWRGGFKKLPNLFRPLEFSPITQGQCLQGLIHYSFQNDPPFIRV